MVVYINIRLRDQKKASPPDNMPGSMEEEAIASAIPDSEHHCQCEIVEDDKVIIKNEKAAKQADEPKNIKYSFDIDGALHVKNHETYVTIPEVFRF